MTDFSHWASMVPDGYFMCCICYEATLIADAATDPRDGQLVDVCLDCAPEAF